MGAPHKELPTDLSPYSNTLNGTTDHGIARNGTEARGLLSPFRYAQEIL